MASRRNMRNNSSSNNSSSRRIARMLNNSSNNSGVSRREQRKNKISSYRPNFPVHFGPRYKNSNNSESRYQQSSTNGTYSNNYSNNYMPRTNEKKGCGMIGCFVVIIVLAVIIGGILVYNATNDNTDYNKTSIILEKE